MFDEEGHDKGRVKTQRSEKIKPEKGPLPK